MKLIINEKPYDLDEAVSEASLGDLYVLKTKLNVSVKTINKTFESLAELVERDDFDPLDLLDDADLMLNLQGMVWLARRKAGEIISLHEAGNIPFNAVRIEGDEEDEVEEPAIDPKAQDSVAGGEIGHDTTTT